MLAISLWDWRVGKRTWILTKLRLGDFCGHSANSAWPTVGVDGATSDQVFGQIKIKKPGPLKIRLKGLKPGLGLYVRAGRPPRLIDQRTAFTQSSSRPGPREASPEWAREQLQSIPLRSTMMPQKHWMQGLDRLITTDRYSSSMSHPSTAMPEI